MLWYVKQNIRETLTLPAKEDAIESGDRGFASERCRGARKSECRLDLLACTPDPEAGHGQPTEADDKVEYLEPEAAAEDTL